MADDVTPEPQDDFDVPAATADVPPGTAATGTEAGTADAKPATDAAAGDGLPAELSAALRHEGLRFIQGETPEAAYARLTFHLSRKSASYGKTIKQMKEEAQAQRAELRELLGPILREHYQRQHRAQVEQEAAQIPDRETDPEGYKVWLNEEVLRRLDAAEQGQQEQALTAEQQEAERIAQQRLAAIDESGYSKVAEGLGLVQGREPDPEFSHAYEVYSEAAVAAARSYFPEASDEQIQEFIGLSQQLDIRRAEMNGVDIRDVMKGRLNGMIESLVRRGLVTRKEANAAAAATTGATGAAGNGHDTKTTAKAPAQTVAQRVTADAAAAAKRATSAVPGSSRPTQLPGQIPDATGMDEDDFVEAALSGILGSEEQRAAPHRKSR